MRHIERVDVLNDRYSHWVVKAPMGRFEWDAEVTDDVPGRLIGWRSCGYAGLNNLGWVSFADVPGGTEVTAVMAYEPPAGASAICSPACCVATPVPASPRTWPS